MALTSRHYGDGLRERAASIHRAGLPEVMKRADLYALVWAKPVTHVAREFGISDVAVRKICIKHGIPTPPLGYWAKLQHGKKVVQPRSTVSLCWCMLF